MWTTYLQFSWTRLTILVNIRVTWKRRFSSLPSMGLSWVYEPYPIASPYLLRESYWLYSHGLYSTPLTRWAEFVWWKMSAPSSWLTAVGLITDSQCCKPWLVYWYTLLTLGRHRNKTFSGTFVNTVQAHTDCPHRSEWTEREFPIVTWT